MQQRPLDGVQHLPENQEPPFVVDVEYDDEIAAAAAAAAVDGEDYYGES
jgi:hypothetical protein